MRIIPARAGPTPLAAIQPRAFTDHPRSCGANRVSAFPARWRYGSSPLVRGQPAYNLMFDMQTRIIPARAGPTIIEPKSTRTATDHPRSCGANQRLHIERRSSPGSSPLVRGQLSDFYWNARFARIIPARAGPTAGRLSSACTSADHPRSCGANL